MADCQALDPEGIAQLLRALLYTFPMRELRVYLPSWAQTQNLYLYLLSLYHI